MSRQDQDINQLMLSIEVRTQDIFDKMTLAPIISGKEARVILGTLGDSSMVAKTTADLNDRINALNAVVKIQGRQISLIIKFLQENQGTKHPTAYSKVCEVFGNIIRCIPL